MDLLTNVQLGRKWENYNKQILNKDVDRINLAQIGTSDCVL
jgi:hypothetical protein